MLPRLASAPPWRDSPKDKATPRLLPSVDGEPLLDWPQPYFLSCSALTSFHAPSILQALIISSPFRPCAWLRMRTSRHGRPRHSKRRCSVRSPPCPLAGLCQLSVCCSAASSSVLV